MAKKRLANKIAWLTELPVFQKYVKPDLETYYAIENYDTVTHYEVNQENEFNIKLPFEDHTMKVCFMDKETTTRFLLQDKFRIIYAETNSSSLKSEVSRFTKNPNNIISRLTEDTSYKKDQKDVITKAQVQYSTVYSKDESHMPIALIKDSYKSDPEEPEKLVKKSSEITNILGFRKDGFWDAYDTLVLNTSNAVGDVVHGPSAYVYTIEDEFIRVFFNAEATSNDTSQYIVPRLYTNIDDDPTKFMVGYSRIAFPDTLYMKEYYQMVGKFAQIYKVERGNMETLFFHNGEEYDYETTSRYSTMGKSREYKITGTTDVPISAEYFRTDIDKYGIPKMPPTSFLESTFICDTTGNYYRTHHKINSVEINGRSVYEFVYDKYGMISNQMYTDEDGKTTDVCHYNKQNIIDDDGNYLGTYVESIVDSNPFSKRTTPEFFYRAILVREGVIQEDYRAILKFDDD